LNGRGGATGEGDLILFLLRRYPLDMPQARCFQVTTLPLSLFLPLRHKLLATIVFLVFSLSLICVSPLSFSVQQRFSISSLQDFIDF
jgi:hypothetical protein